MKHEPLLLLVQQAIDPLPVRNGPQRSENQGLGLAAVEDGGTVGARQHPHPATDGADLILTASVGPSSIFYNHPATVFLTTALKAALNAQPSSSASSFRSSSRIFSLMAETAWFRSFFPSIDNARESSEAARSSTL